MTEYIKEQNDIIAVESIKMTKQKIASEHSQIYEEKINIKKVDPSILFDNFHRSKISYTPNSPYRSFSY